jgi:hypothetical protein
MKTIEVVVTAANLLCIVFNIFCIIRLRRKTRELIAARKNLEQVIANYRKMVKESGAEKA